MSDASVIDRPARMSLGATIYKTLSSKTGAWIGFIFACAAIYVGWAGRDHRSIDAGEGLGYFLGVAGATAMLLLLLYSFRKRFKITRRFGATRYWFRAHMTLGVVGPVLILYHSNFQVGSLNSRVALYCTLVVALSGLVGRFLYTQIHHGLYGRKASLRELGHQLTGETTSNDLTNGIFDDIRADLIDLANRALSAPDTMAQSLRQAVALGWRTRIDFYRMSWQVRRNVIARGKNSPAFRQHRGRLQRSARTFLRHNLREIRQVATFSAYERLFSLWHVIHVPFFLMMVLSAVVHVLAVHIY